METNLKTTIIQSFGDKVRLLAGANTWVEGEAVRQLKAVSEWPGMVEAVGLPDIQPGKGSPSGAAFLSQNYIHPTLVGTDIGCGMSLHCTDLPIHKAKIDRLVDALDGMDQPWDGNTSAWLHDRNIDLTPYDMALGTPGRGNHFIELQQIDRILNAGAAERIGLSAAHIHVLVHSGSRGFGESVLTDTVRLYGATPLEADSAEGKLYLQRHEHAVLWARANRDLCAHRACAALKIDASPILDICHNAVSSIFHNGCHCWLHRKGAAPADKGPIVIPGSRGDFSAVVLPKIGAQSALESLAHGAGRKIARHQARDKLRSLHKRADLKRNRWGGTVICGEDQLAWEEAPECYKSLSSVISDMEEAGLIDVIAYLRPLVTFKTSEGAREEQRANRRDWKDERREARTFKNRSRA